ncbi:SUMF1/EgtB/PvdO family nonheme iron enzyme [Streptomyces manipurensis]|uniref:SUMF1/EgtB/PvdO family nonheme iron enzyme n=1 Tax=Streptomyces manipurensis TaxID=1077945 RepID=UPI003C70096B
MRTALRMTVRTFAVHIGVSDRMVSHWERGGVGIVPRPSNQSALDTALSIAGAEAQERFAVLITEQAAVTTDQRTEVLLASDPLKFVRHPVDGKLMVLVPEGIYLGGDAGETTWLPAFHLDVSPTTNADYSRFVSATGHPAPQHWDGPRYPHSLFDHPVVWVTWHDAAAYAAWAGKTLPTSAQWEKAARGAKGNIYPCGNSATAAKCNVADSGIGHTTPVSRYRSGASSFGAYDLCGNVWEWCATDSAPGRKELKGSAYVRPSTTASTETCGRYLRRTARASSSWGRG